MTRKTFASQAEAIATLAPLFKSGKIGCFTPSTVYGKTYAKVFFCGGWRPLTDNLFSALVAA